MPLPDLPSFRRRPDWRPTILLPESAAAISGRVTATTDKLAQSAIAIYNHGAVNTGLRPLSPELLIAATPDLAARHPQIFAERAIRYGAEILAGCEVITEVLGKPLETMVAGLPAINTHLLRLAMDAGATPRQIWHMANLITAIPSRFAPHLSQALKEKMIDAAENLRPANWTQQRRLTRLEPLNAAFSLPQVATAAVLGQWFALGMEAAYHTYETFNAKRKKFAQSTLRKADLMEQIDRDDLALQAALEKNRETVFRLEQELRATAENRLLAAGQAQRLEVARKIREQQIARRAYDGALLRLEELPYRDQAALEGSLGLLAMQKATLQQAKLALRRTIIFAEGFNGVAHIIDLVVAAVNDLGDAEMERLGQPSNEAPRLQQAITEAKGYQASVARLFQSPPPEPGPVIENPGQRRR